MKLYGKLISICKSHREMVSYLFFGVLTTAVSFVTYMAFERLIGLDTVTSNVISWVISVAFAYITNRIYVFKSKKIGLANIVTEVGAFFASRLFSGVIETLIMFVFVDKLGYYDVLVKAVATVIVIVLNYILSKLLVFRKKKN